MAADEQNFETNRALQQKRTYAAPQLQLLGTVAELTRGTGTSGPDSFPAGTKKVGG